MADQKVTGGAAAVPQNNRKALISVICGITGWVLFCFNSTIGTLISLVTLGIGSICLIPLGCLVPILWIVAVVTGHMGLKEIDRSGGAEGGRGMAMTGLISSYIGLGLMLLFIILGVILTLVGASIPVLDSIVQGF